MDSQGAMMEVTSRWQHGGIFTPSSPNEPGGALVMSKDEPGPWCAPWPFRIVKPRQPSVLLGEEQLNPLLAGAELATATEYYPIPLQI